MGPTPISLWRNTSDFKRRKLDVGVRRLIGKLPRTPIHVDPKVSLLDNEIDFRISFDESDDEDYMVVYDENSFSHKIISVNNLKTDSENDNDKVNMPSFPSPEPTEPSEEIDNIGGVFINLEISKCWSLEISDDVLNTFCSRTQIGVSLKKNQGKISVLI
ncbi:hypothetical protein Tco_1266250 [Tanacetum coccineum]